jgi:hypothetical protein
VPRLVPTLSVVVVPLGSSNRQYATGASAFTVCEYASLTGVVTAPGFVTAGARFATTTVQVNDWLVLSWPSDTVMVTGELAGAALTVPLITPVAALMVRPLGKPVAVYVSVSPSSSLATMGSETTEPVAVVTGPIAATVGA